MARQDAVIEATLLRPDLRMPRPERVERVVSELAAAHRLTARPAVCDHNDCLMFDLGTAVLLITAPDKGVPEDLLVGVGRPGKAPVSKPQAMALAHAYRGTITILASDIAPAGLRARAGAARLCLEAAWRLSEELGRTPVLWNETEMLYSAAEFGCVSRGEDVRPPEGPTGAASDRTLEARAMAFMKCKIHNRAHRPARIPLRRRIGAQIGRLRERFDPDRVLDGAKVGYTSLCLSLLTMHAAAEEIFRF